MRKEGCLRETCKAGVWRHSLDPTVCCYDRRPHEVDTVITSSTSTDGCTITEVACTKDAKTLLHTRNSCPRLATFEQVEEIKTLIETHLGESCPGVPQLLSKWFDLCLVWPTYSKTQTYKQKYVLICLVSFLHSKKFRTQHCTLGQHVDIDEE